MAKIRTYTPENASKHTMIMERCATQQPTTLASIVRIVNPLSRFGKAIKLYNLNKTIQILYVTFSLPIQIKRQTTWQLFVYFVDKATKREIVSSYPKAKTRVYPRRDSKNSDGTPFWMQNDNTRPTNLISSTLTKNSLQNRNIRTPSPTSAGTRRFYVQNALKNWVNLSRLRFFFSIVPCQNQHNQRWRTRRGAGMGPNRFVLQLFTSGSHLGVQHLCKHAPKTTSIFWGYFHGMMGTGENLFFIANLDGLVESSCTLGMFRTGFADVFLTPWHIFLT